MMTQQWLVPATFENAYGPIQGDINEILYTVYFPLINTDKLDGFEEQLIRNNKTASLEQIRENFVDVEKREKGTQWLQQNGNLTWLSKSGTMGLWIASKQFLSSIPNLVQTENFYGRVNEYYRFPHDLKVAFFNYENASIQRKTLDQWTQDLKLTNNSIQSHGLHLDPIVPNSIPNQSIGLIEFNVISKDSLRAFTEFYNTAYSASYTPEHFYDLVQYFYIDSFGNLVLVGLTDSTYEHDLENASEALTDIFLCLQLNPEVQLYCNLLDRATSDPNIAIHYALENGFKIYNWSSSIGSRLKISREDYSRFRIETRFFGMSGVNLFGASGDQGSWSYSLNNDKPEQEKFDVKTPDQTINTLFGDGVLNVGGFYKMEDSHVLMNIASLISEEYSYEYPSYIPFIFGSAGGYFRGYPEVSFKQTYVNKYPYQSSICQHMFEDGNINSVDCQYQRGGKGNPDIINQAIMMFPPSNLPNPNITVGTSIASPYTASQFLRIRPIPCFYRILYTKKFNEFLLRPITGRNTLYNLLGYSAHVSGNWDPVQGRGVIDIDKATKALSGDLAYFLEKD